MASAQPKHLGCLPCQLGFRHKPGRVVFIFAMKSKMPEWAVPYYILAQAVPSWVLHGP
jgi:hypothetical protein